MGPFSKSAEAPLVEVPLLYRQVIFYSQAAAVPCCVVREDRFKDVSILQRASGSFSRIKTTTVSDNLKAGLLHSFLVQKASEILELTGKLGRGDSLVTLQRGPTVCILNAWRWNRKS